MPHVYFNENANRYSTSYHRGQPDNRRLSKWHYIFCGDDAGVSGIGSSGTGGSAGSSLPHEVIMNEEIRRNADAMAGMMCLFRIWLDYILSLQSLSYQITRHAPIYWNPIWQATDRYRANARRHE